MIVGSTGVALKVKAEPVPQKEATEDAATVGATVTVTADLVLSHEPLFSATYKVEVLHTFPV